MDMTAEDQEFVFQLVAAILHLGNVSFDVKPGADKACQVTNPATLAQAAQLLEVEPSRLDTALTSRIFMSEGKRITVPYNTTEGQNARDGLARALYHAMFSRIITRINRALGANLERAVAELSRKPLVTGVLDIFGFESFQFNVR